VSPSREITIVLALTSLALHLAGRMEAQNPQGALFHSVRHSNQTRHRRTTTPFKVNSGSASSVMQSTAALWGRSSQSRGPISHELSARAYFLGPRFESLSAHPSSHMKGRSQ
jgi:hypothetical protein